MVAIGQFISDRIGLNGTLLLKQSAMTSRRKEFFPEVTDEQWNDWHWQVKNRIETLEQLKKYIRLTREEEEGVRESLKTLRMAITPYYLSLIDPDNPHCPIP